MRCAIRMKHPFAGRDITTTGIDTVIETAWGWVRPASPFSLWPPHPPCMSSSMRLVISCWGFAALLFGERA